MHGSEASLRASPDVSLRKGSRVLWWSTLGWVSLCTYLQKNISILMFIPRDLGELWITRSRHVYREAGPWAWALPQARSSLFSLSRELQRQVSMGLRGVGVSRSHHCGSQASLSKHLDIAEEDRSPGLRAPGDLSGRYGSLVCRSWRHRYVSFLHFS